MRNTAEYEEYLTNPLEYGFAYEPKPQCDECGEPQDEQPWCGECGCCDEHCQALAGCFPDWEALSR